MPKFPQDLNDWDEYRGMVRWFSPSVLIKTVEKVLASTLFGRYADRRLVHAALDSPIDSDKLIENYCGGPAGVCAKKSEVWIDYVADLGDGFDSTYAIAYLIGQKSIAVNDLQLPRADCLIMGGDQVYPDASPEDYQKRMQRPYRAAFPRTRKANAVHPPVYLIPGNHDWYDGLTIFLARFCNGRSDNFLGSWIASQRRSYFAVHLAENWWIWGFDSQLGEDIDRPQSEYFEAVAKKIPADSKIILCASVPTWLKASLATTNKEEERAIFYRSLGYMSDIIREKCPKAKVPLVLAGDLHHYSRYVADPSGTTFITAGGGGAFLHPTHDLIEDQLDIKWGLTNQALKIGTDGSADVTRKSIYPPQDESRRFALRNLWFFYTNPDFCYKVLGPLYLVCALLMLAWRGYGETGGTVSFPGRVWNQINILWPTPAFLFAVIVFGLLFYKSADIKSAARKRVIAPLHSLMHLVIILTGTALVSIAVVDLQSINLFGDILYFLGLAVLMILLGFVGGAVWGIYLTMASWFWGDEANSAFSAIRLDSYNHFLRLKIDGDKLTVYPIGIEESPVRSDWKINDEFNNDDPDQDTPAIVPNKELGQHLIENPIIIDINNVNYIRANS